MYLLYQLPTSIVMTHDLEKYTFYFSSSAICAKSFSKPYSNYFALVVISIFPWNSIKCYILSVNDYLQLYSNSVAIIFFQVLE